MKTKHKMNGKEVACYEWYMKANLASGPCNLSRRRVDGGKRIIRDEGFHLTVCKKEN
jgi:hypothetical protein